ncbi:ABC transporter permease [Mesorhizobium sp. M4B.F.Ca.ET.215.01.1.1]|uniref:ABC transporter permease n=3 Tax=Mesorhizobium TaxID=68287 RepID=UPI000FCC5A80|nr:MULTISPECIES: ABC transporter permease [unclassified Mesorhizobium]RUW26258.1 ABC transporter permease [Mesorhizobium sp. M4B.F.Ca.ET.013.02.1.1]RVD44146.1 ABC transporter permease [Mesorhizobium sp. M4B.F.Ca.ET.019.03.1.1]TGQ05127.1 ABC transporter permease [Mesorhizobium sp. M4B.F.Ca.ET.215.01.1.1]TGQ33638.1 ABC transporter permease [Mesorhizobium sp. M4B.F.Ca.ET.214.01.1.1]TGQ40826.1 ABC transporter permease [Mesorhizobium sp. M00.F.Ca.ET.220.01.1.1]
MTLHVDIPEETLAGILAKAFRNRSFLVGFVITALVGAVAVLSYAWTPYDVTRLVISDKTLAPSWAHWFGTDHFGRDILSMIMVGARNSIAVALVAVGIGMGVGVPLGAFAAARGGLADEALMRLNDLVFAFPALLSAIMITAIFGPGAINAIIAIGIFNIPVFARVARAGALAIWPREFILAARAAGKGPTLITIEHILPNIATLLLVQGTIQFALGILAEAGLSYVGLGAQPPMPSWGRMLFDAQTRMVVAPWMAIFPGMAIAVTVLGLNLLGDGIADILDPKSRRQR